MKFIESYKKIILTTLFLLSNLIPTFSQDVESGLNGFKLRQFKEAVKNEYGKPIQVNKFDDGFEAEIYIIKPDSSAYVIFEYPNWNKEVIFSIQIYGAFGDIDPKFKGLKMGITEKELIEIVGKPSSSKDIGEYGKTLEFENTNYSFEINNNGELSSIKIIDNYNTVYSNLDVEKIPSINRIKEVLKSNNPKIISELLSPELEFYVNAKTLYFKYSWMKEINSDKSGIYRNINEVIVGIDDVDITDINQYEENIRLIEGKNPMHVMKFKNGIKIKEIVLKWENGKYVIWEIKT